MLFKALLICIVLLGLASYLSYLRTGQFWVPNFSMNNVNLAMPSFSSNPFSGKSDSAQTSQGPVAAESVAAPTTTTYKWYQNGRWHYGDSPPKGVRAELISSPEK